MKYNFAFYIMIEIILYLDPFENSLSIIYFYF